MFLNDLFRSIMQEINGALYMYLMEFLELKIWVLNLKFDLKK